jgi:DNA-binding CsgD family transcriptional regulator
MTSGGGVTFTGQLLRDRLDHGLRRMQQTTGLPAGFAGVVGADGNGDHLVLERFRGTRTTALDGLRVVRGQGLGGLALSHGRPFVVNDYRSNKFISHDYDSPVVAEALTAVFAYPVRVGGHIEAVIYGASRDDRPIGDTALRRAGEVAATVAAEVSELLRAPRLSRPLLSTADALAELESIAVAVGDEDLQARLLHAHRSLAPRAAAPRSAVVRLAPREEQCLSLAAVGATNQQIAETLELSPETVKAYLRSAMRRLKVNNRTGAVHAARSAGLI